MYSAVFMITFTADADTNAKEDLKTLLQQSADSLSSVNIMGDVLPYAFGGGDLFLELGYENRDTFAAAKETSAWNELNSTLENTGIIDHYEYVAYGDGKMNITSETAGCHRVLIYEIIPDADPASLKKMEQIMPDMCLYIPGLLNCKLARVDECSGRKKWGYAFECDYDDPMTFLTNYNYRPYHWTNVDKFFEPACAEWVADPDLCTPYIAADTAFLTNYAE